MTPENNEEMDVDVIDVDYNPLETEQGVWTTFRGTRLCIAHVSSMKFQKKLARLQQPHTKMISRGKLPPNVQKVILCKAMAGTILVNAEFYRKVRDADDKVVMVDGKPKLEVVAFGEDLAEQVLANQFDVREFVTEYASDLDNYRQEETEEVGKSS